MITAALITAVCSLGGFLVGALAVQIRSDLHLQLSQIGILIALFFAVSALMSWPAGLLVERVGAEESMRASVMIAAFSLVVAGAAQGFGWLVAAMAITGIANAFGQLGANLFIVRSLPVSRHGLAFGVKQAGIPTATLFGGLAVPLIALTVGWRWGFFFGAIFAVGVRTLVPKQSHGGVPLGFNRGSRSDLPTFALIVLGIGAALGAASADSLGAFFVDSAVASGLPPGAAGLLYALGSATGLVARVAVGWAADRRTSGRLVWVAAQLLAGAVGYGLLASGSSWLLIPATVMCFAGGWGWAGLLNFAVVRQNTGLPAAATGITQSGGHAGGVMGPPLFGFVAEHASYPMAWTLAAALVSVGALAILMGRHLLLQHAIPE